MFVAKLSESALTAVSLAFPVQNLMIAVGTGTGVGINALVSRSLGEKKQEYANSAANNGIYLAIFSFIGFAIVCGFFAPAFFRVQTTDPQIMKYGVDENGNSPLKKVKVRTILTCKSYIAPAYAQKQDSMIKTPPVSGASPDRGCLVSFTRYS